MTELADRAMVADPMFAPLRPPRACRCCAEVIVYAPQWLCAVCYIRLDLDLRGQVWAVADLACDDPAKKAVIAACEAATAATRMRNLQAARAARALLRAGGQC